MRAWLAALRFAVAPVERLLGVVARFFAAFLAVVPLAARVCADVARFFAVGLAAALFRARLAVAPTLRAPGLALFRPVVRLLCPALLLRLLVVFEVIIFPLVSSLARAVEPPAPGFMVRRRSQRGSARHVPRGHRGLKPAARATARRAALEKSGLSGLPWGGDASARVLGAVTLPRAAGGTHEDPREQFPHSAERLAPRAAHSAPSAL